MCLILNTITKVIKDEEEREQHECVWVGGGMAQTKKNR